MSAEKRSVSAPADLFARADARCKALGYTKFSDYIQALIRQDVINERAHIREASPGYKTNSPEAMAGGEIPFSPETAKKAEELMQALQSLVNPPLSTSTTNPPNAPTENAPAKTASTPTISYRRTGKGQRSGKTKAKKQ